MLQSHICLRLLSKWELQTKSPPVPWTSHLNATEQLMLVHLCGNMYNLITRSDFARKSFLAPAILFSVVVFHIIVTDLWRKRLCAHSWQHRGFSRKQELSSDQQRLLCRSKSLLASIQNELPLEKEKGIKTVSFIQNLSQPSTLGNLSS